MPKIIITRSTVCGGVAVDASDKPINASDSDARVLIGMGKAVAADEKSKGKPAKNADNDNGKQSGGND